MNVGLETVRRTILALILITLLSFAFIHGVARNELMLDEAYTALVSVQDLCQIMSSEADDGSPPLYYFLTGDSAPGSRGVLGGKEPPPAAIRGSRGALFFLHSPAALYGLFHWVPITAGKRLPPRRR